MPCRHVLAQGIGGRAANCHVWRLCEARPAGYGVRHLWLSECTPPSARLPQRLLHGMPRQVDMRADRRRHRAPELPDARLRRSAFGARHQAPWKARPPQRRAPEAAPGAPQRWKAGRVAARAQRGGPGPHGVGDDVHTGVPTLLRARAKVDWLQPHHVLVQGRAARRGISLALCMQDTHALSCYGPPLHQASHRERMSLATAPRPHCQASSATSAASRTRCLAATPTTTAPRGRPSTRRACRYPTACSSAKAARRRAPWAS
mmetsp:Transcript_34049/g.101424  ORF Transcript_34049/g.101424 Transcript_34049/m.101424 type:complete len:261 (-) Transcript_34049:816-1598(-)